MVGNKWDTYLDLLQAEYSEGWVLCSSTVQRSAQVHDVIQRHYAGRKLSDAVSLPNLHVGYVRLLVCGVQGCLGCSRPHKVLLQTHANDTCGLDREASKL